MRVYIFKKENRVIKMRFIGWSMNDDDNDDDDRVEWGFKVKNEKEEEA